MSYPCNIRVENMTFYFLKLCQKACFDKECRSIVKSLPRYAVNIDSEVTCCRINL